MLLERRHQIGLAAGVVIVLTLVPSAQTPRGSATTDDLLAEVRALRADMAEAATASIRAQLLTARLQLIEQRVYEVSRQLDNMQTSLSVVRAEIADLETRVKNGEEALARDPRNEQERAMLAELPPMIAAWHVELDQKQERETELRREESALQDRLNAEQGRWNEVSQRLDSLEGSLPIRVR
jgi:hypothetical protein